VTRVLVDCSGRVVCHRCAIADTAPARMKGLLGRQSLPVGEGVLLRPAGSVHTAFMRFPIDAVFLDQDLRVLHLESELRPWRAAGKRGARAVLELASGECSRLGLEPGDRLLLADDVEG
jgi:uncharacterized protein